MNILITGVAGFIGAALSLRLLNEGHRVWGIDNLNDYYDVSLKKDRLSRLSRYPDFKLWRWPKYGIEPHSLAAYA